MIHTLAWATTRTARGRDDDEPPALAALAELGVRVDVLDWDDPAARWASYDRVALRSTWDYADRPAEFARWLEGVDGATELVNPFGVVRWNLDKHYLAELADAGVPTVPTVFVEPDGEFTPPGGAFVVKPAVGAGSRETAVYRPGQEERAGAHVRRLQARGEALLVQPLLASVERDGEWPLVFLGGTYSHAASKRVALPASGTVEDLFAAETNTPHVASAAQLDVARAAAGAVADRFGPVAYARVDLVRDDAGEYRVLEVELVEPSLFLTQGGPDAARRLARALAA